MRIELQERGAFGSALIHLEGGDEFRSDSGAMFRASHNIDIDVTRKTKGGGGFLQGVKRMMSGESFFYSTYRTNDGRPGEVGLAPVHQGEVKVIEVSADNPWMCTGGSYLGASSGLDTDAQFQGMKGFFTGEALFFLEVSGSGRLLVSAFGRLVELDVDEPITVDTGHVAAFQKSLSYTITKAGSSWLQSWIAGEGFVMNFTGKGKLLVQSHNPKEFGQWLGPRLPQRS